jgi:hypothetical protein
LMSLGRYQTPERNVPGIESEVFCLETLHYPLRNSENKCPDREPYNMSAWPVLFACSLLGRTIVHLPRFTAPVYDPKSQYHRSRHRRKDKHHYDDGEVHQRGPFVEVWLDAFRRWCARDGPWIHSWRYGGHCNDADVWRRDERHGEIILKLEPRTWQPSTLQPPSSSSSADSIDSRGE